MADIQGRTDSKRLVRTAVIALLLALSDVWAAPRYVVLHNFGNGKDGGGPWSSVFLDKDGNLYGTTSGGGAYGGGAVYELMPHPSGKWIERILHSFRSDRNGSEPFGGLTPDRLGGFYGTTSLGGSHGAGIVFELTRDSSGVWRETVLYSFGTQRDDGGFPMAGVFPDKAGNLYGTAPRGGSTVFKLTQRSSAWNEIVLHKFTRKSDGADAFAPVTLDPTGKLYGTTQGGGAYDVGTVYEVEHTDGAWKERVLHSFYTDGIDGSTPGNGALARDGQGNLYGTTEVGGRSRWGIVYKLTLSKSGQWHETILYHFNNGPSGGFPVAGVVLDKEGNLYGTATSGGTACDCGVVFKLAPGSNGKWTYTVLHRFTGYDGAQPVANLIFDNKGNLYGTTVLGGAYGSGVAFQLTPYY